MSRRHGILGFILTGILTQFGCKGAEHRVDESNALSSHGVVQINVLKCFGKYGGNPENKGHMCCLVKRQVTPFASDYVGGIESNEGELFLAVLDDHVPFTDQSMIAKTKLKIQSLDAQDARFAFLTDGEKPTRVGSFMMGKEGAVHFMSICGETDGPEATEEEKKFAKICGIRKVNAIYKRRSAVPANQGVSAIEFK